MDGVRISTRGCVQRGRREVDTDTLVLGTKAFRIWKMTSKGLYCVPRSKWSVSRRRDLTECYQRPASMHLCRQRACLICTKCWVHLQQYINLVWWCTNLKLALHGWWHKDQKFEVIHSYAVSQRMVWVTWDSVSFRGKGSCKIHCNVLESHLVLVVLNLKTSQFKCLVAGHSG